MINEQSLKKECMVALLERKCMDRMNCVLLEDNILEFLDEVDQQIKKNLVCCKCPNPCDKTSRCALAMQNLLVDIKMFKEAYMVHNNIEEEIQQK